MNAVAGTNLKVGSRCPTNSAGNEIICCCAPTLFWLYKYGPTISRFGERFRDGQYRLVSFLFAILLLTVTLCPANCKSGDTCTVSRRHCMNGTVKNSLERRTVGPETK